MASAADPAAPIVFHEDEDLLDDDDDDESFDHYDDDSASSAPVAPIAPDRPPQPLSAAQVTIAVPGLPDPHHHQPEISVPAKKPPPPPPDESRKLFQRLWTDEDEIELLQGFLDYTTQRCGPHSSSQHHHDTTAFYDQIRSKFQLDFNKNQLVEKLRRLKKKYRNVIGKFGTGKDYAFKTPHEQATFEISSKIWGNAVVNGAAAYRAAPAPIDEDDDSLNNPNFNNFVDCQSPNLNGIDINAKTPRSRKRNRVGAVKLEEKQHNSTNINISNAQPVSAVAPMAAPVIGLGITGSLSGVIEETLKSCLSPIFKELLSNSMSPNLNSNGSLCCGNGFGLGRSPIPLCFGTSMGADKERWRKQQILELEVFSKRLELVQDEIREQLQELRSTGN
ncbi:putative transcription factor [Salvia divinorum]|uniref:Transcription factor n=1 Tax=Salvia divinorum TaxID=28513 RepID=A0ABD1GPJ1_SALDI